jgi:hypothetical protein
MLISCEKEPIILNDNGRLPVINLLIPEKYLWSPDSGLYVIGNNGIKYDECPYTANYNQKWEFPAYIEYYENNTLKFSDNVGFRIKGQCSRGNPMKSFGLYWRKEYGNSTLEYPMFPDISVTTFKRLFFRNSGNDFGKSHIKDASIAMIFKDYAKVDYQEYKPCVLYLNEAYWGIHNIREMITPHHFQYHYGVDKDHVDLLEGSELHPEADDGSADDYLNDVIAYLQSHDLSMDENYVEFSNLIDIGSYVDNIIINTYIGKSDWPCNNTKWWRDRTSVNSKWRWVVIDNDLSFKMEQMDKVWIGDLYGIPVSEERKEGFFIFNHLIKNESFIEFFLDRYMFFIDTVFEKKRVERIILESKHKIAPEYDNHQKKWNTAKKAKWDRLIDEMIEFNNERNDTMREIINKLKLDNENK